MGRYSLDPPSPRHFPRLPRDARVEEQREFVSCVRGVVALTATQALRLSLEAASIAPGPPPRSPSPSTIFAETETESQSQSVSKIVGVDMASTLDSLRSESSRVLERRSQEIRMRNDSMHRSIEIAIASQRAESQLLIDRIHADAAKADLEEAMARKNSDAIKAREASDALKAKETKEAKEALNILQAQKLLDNERAVVAANAAAAVASKSTTSTHSTSSLYSLAVSISEPYLAHLTTFKRDSLPSIKSDKALLNWCFMKKMLLRTKIGQISNVKAVFVQKVCIRFGVSL